LAGLLSMMRNDSVEPNLSHVILNDNQPVGVAMIARRGWGSRLDHMHIIPDAGGKGIGGVVIKQLLAEAQERGDRTMTLEVVQENAPGARLYTNSGFKTNRRFVGFVGQPQGSASDTEIQEIDVHEVALRAHHRWSNRYC